MQKRLKEAFAATRQLTSEEAEKQCRYYDRNARAVALQSGDVVMVRTDVFKGKRKVGGGWLYCGVAVGGLACLQDQMPPSSGPK